MSILINPYAFGVINGLPSNSTDFELSSTQYLSMAHGTFRDYNRKTFAISFWAKSESLAATATIISRYGGAGAREFTVEAPANRKLQFKVFDGTTALGTIQAASTTTFPADAGDGWNHFLLVYDSTQGTSGERMRMYKNGTEITSFDVETQPSLNDTVGDTTVDTLIGNDINSGSQYYDGKLYQVTFFSGIIPDVGDLYSAGPVDISAVTGIHSILDPDESVTWDGALKSDWTNNGTVTTSVDIPT